jgi:prophage antirepressor-like protein
MSFIFKHNNNDFELINYGTIKEPYFKAKQIATFLGYIDTTQAIRKHVWDINKTTFLGSVVLTPPNYQSTTIYINESGLYQLIFASKMDIAQKFQKWVFEIVLPSIRKTNAYQFNNHSVKPNLTFKIDNEFDLHKQIINFCKVQYPEILLIIQSGELQDTQLKRTQEYYKGYQSGSYDVIIGNLNKKFNGFCIEFKSPNGKGIISQKQLEMQKKYEMNGYKTLITNDYNKCIIEIIEYMRETRIKCLHCNRKFKNSSTLSNHYKFFHKIKN